jgi:class 3 adenylate cyclase
LNETERTLLIADLSGYTALTETHGAVHASEVVLRFNRMAEAGIEPGVAIIDRVGDQVLCAGADTHAVLRSALRLCATVEREPDFPGVQAAIHRGGIVERDGRLFGAPLNLTARLAAHARSGQILCTEPIANEAREHAGVEARFIGERHFRNVPLPIAVYELLRVSQVAQSSVVDPVCRMQIDPRGAAATLSHMGTEYHFCSVHCARLFGEAPERYARLWG